MNVFRKLFVYIIGVFLSLSIIMSLSYYVGKHSEDEVQILKGIPKKLVELIISPIRITNRFFEHEDGRIIKNNKIRDGVTIFSRDTLYNSLNILTSYQIKEAFIIELLNLGDGKSIKKWNLVYSQITDSLLNGENRMSKTKTIERLQSIPQFRHPILLKDSSIIIGGEGFLKINKESKIIWVNSDVKAHHSLELDHEDNIWISGRRLKSELPELKDKESGVFLDDLIMKIDPNNGKVIFEKSVIQILKDNHLYDLVFKNGNYEYDPIHLNDVQPALFSSDFWRKGDLLISSRHLSTVLLYRPSSNIILWYKQGPWLNQHDPDFLDRNKISIFGNQVLRGEMTNKLKFPSKFNSVFVYDFNNDTVTEPYKTFLESEKIRTITEGRSEILVNGDLFVEETNKGIVYIGDSIQKKLAFSRRLNEEEITYLQWSRLIKN